MKSDRFRLSAALCALLFLLLPVTASANAAEPPAFTLLVSGGRDIASVTLTFEDGTEEDAVPLHSSRRAWETYYRFYYSQRSNLAQPRNARAAWVNVYYRSGSGGGECKSFPFPEAAAESYTGVWRISGGELVPGGSPWRKPLLVSLRIVLTLLIEGAVFFRSGFRERRSWLIFLAVNLATQLFLNLWILDGFSSVKYDWPGHLFPALLLGEVLILMVEAVVYVLFIRERDRYARAGCAFAANLLSFLAGGAAVSLLPL